MVDFKDFMLGDDHVIDEARAEAKGDAIPEKWDNKNLSAPQQDFVLEARTRMDMLGITTLQTTPSGYSPTPPSSHGHTASAPGQAKGGVKGI